jgi:hypothetical protein
VNRLEPIELAFFVLIVVMLFAEVLLADEVICPVCGKSFPDDTKTCPNDGTDLKSLGIPLEKDMAKSRQQSETEAEEEPLSDETYKDNEESSKYRRFDQGGARRSTKRDEVNYKDRESRISKATRARSSDEDDERRARLERFNKEDLALLREYEERRALSWENQQRVHVAELRASRDRAAAQSHLLNTLGAPFTSLGYRLFWMTEGDDAGLVNTAEIDLNLARYRLRAGLSTLIGVRSLSDRDELVFLEHVSVGFQWPWRFSPYIAARAGVGALVSERLGEDLVYLLTSVGAEAGIDSWVTPWIAVTPSFGYFRCMINNAYWNSFTFKVSVGF